MKKKAQKLPVNRCFGGNCPKNPQKTREEQIKELLMDVNQRRRANREISRLLKQFKGRYSLLKCLELIGRRYPLYVLKVAIERVEKQRMRDELTMEEIIDFERFKASLDEPKQ